MSKTLSRLSLLARQRLLKYSCPIAMNTNKEDINVYQNGEISEPLSSEERRLLTHSEKTIKKGWKTFIEVGKALSVIRDNRLYREDYPNFQAYTRDKWQYIIAYADRLIGASEVLDDLTPIGVKILPVNEAQFRPLLAVPREKRPEAWEKVLEASEGKKLTASLIRQVASEFSGTKPKPQRRRTTSADWISVSENLNNALNLVKGSDYPADLVSAIEDLENAIKKVMPKI